MSIGRPSSIEELLLGSGQGLPVPGPLEAKYGFAVSAEANRIAVEQGSGKVGPVF